MPRVERCRERRKPLRLWCFGSRVLCKRRLRGAGRSSKTQRRTQRFVRRAVASVWPIAREWAITRQPAKATLGDARAMLLTCGRPIAPSALPSRFSHPPRLNYSRTTAMLTLLCKLHLRRLHPQRHRPRMLAMAAPGWHRHCSRPATSPHTASDLPWSALDGCRRRGAVGAGD